MTAMKVWLFPDPLSPTTPRVSPGRTSREIPRTAGTDPSRVWKSMRRSSIERTGLGGVCVTGGSAGVRRNIGATAQKGNRQTAARPLDWLA
jgi:hypothetical protein